MCKTQKTIGYPDLEVISKKKQLTCYRIQENFKGIFENNDTVNFIVVLDKIFIGTCFEQTSFNQGLNHRITC